MIRLSNKHIALIASLFIAIFMGALTITTLCDLEIIDYASNLPHHHEKTNVTTAKDHHGKHEHDNQSHVGEHDQSSETDECCDDVATSLESSLFSGIVKSYVPAAKFFLAGIIELKPQIISQYQTEDIIYHEYDDPPPLNGFKLRVEIQSFLN